MKQSFHQNLMDLAPSAPSLLTLCRQHEVANKQLQALAKLLELNKKSKLLSTIEALLDWDKETHMPSGSLKSRAEQSSLMRKLAHDCNTDACIPELFHQLGVNEETPFGDASLPASVRAVLHKKYRQWKKAVSIPPTLAAQMAQEAVLGYGAWIEAKKKKDFSIFKPNLASLVELSKNYADCIGYKHCRYDALLDDYEPGSTTRILDPLFSSLQMQLTPLYAELCEKNKYSIRWCTLEHPECQKKFCRELMHGLKYTSGRIDAAEHPFCAAVGSRDVRITTRYIETDPLSAIFSTLHETGHALYELNICPIYDCTVCADGASYGVHESQSRFIENVIGRSRAFWTYWYPQLQKHYSSFADVSLDDFMARVLLVQKNPIRTESDEAGYNLHIILRFEMEKILFEDPHAAENAPCIWNDLSKKILDITPSDDGEGVLQDVHWSHGAFGYFPSYTLGNIYAAQLKKELEHAVPDYEQDLERGSIESVLQWLTQRVHKYGASVLPMQLYPDCKISCLIDYLQQRYSTE